MKLTYVYPPQFVQCLPWVTRIMYNTLDADFFQCTDPDIFDIISSEHDNLNFPEHMWKKTRPAYFYHRVQQGIYDEILASVNTDTILLTINCVEDLNIADFYLKRGHRVCAGGSYINVMGIEAVRQQIDDKNLMLFEGYFDSSINLDVILNKWDDVKITKNSFESYWDHKTDFHKMNDPNVTISFGFETKCAYSQCRFCSYKNIPYSNFIDNTSHLKVIDNMYALSEFYNTKRIRLIDSLFTPTTQKIEILEELKRDFMIVLFSSIRLLKSRIYIDVLNKCAGTLLIGMESTNDSSLSIVNKGHSYNDIKLAMEQIKNRLHKNIKLMFFIIDDLPVKYEYEMTENKYRYERIADDLRSCGFSVEFVHYPLSLANNAELLSSKYIRIEDNENISGINYIMKKMKEKIPDMKLDITPIVKIGEDGRIIKSEYDYD